MRINVFTRLWVVATVTYSVVNDFPVVFFLLKRDFLLLLLKVSPAKPPLPKLRSATDFPHTRDRTSRDKAEAEDSPWDSDEDEDDDRDDDQYDEGNPTNGVTDAGHGESKKTFQKPSQGRESSLYGFYFGCIAKAVIMIFVEL